MPLYVYACPTCREAVERLQSLSAPAPRCEAHPAPVAMVKQVTAAAFQLKGTGWYASDFKRS